LTIKKSFAQTFTGTFFSTHNFILKISGLIFFRHDQGEKIYHAPLKATGYF